MKYARIISLIAASTMLVTFSAHAYDKDGDKAYKPKQAEPMQRYTLTGGATYLIPTMNGLDFVGTTDGSGTDSINNTYQLDPSYNWGYFLAFGYMINSKYDIQATWQQYNADSSESLSTSLDFVTTNGNNKTGPGSAKTHDELNTQAFDATLGQYHKLAKTLTARPFIGVKYAKVNDTTLNTYTNASGIETDEYKSSFSGVGPELGLDVEYGVYRQLGVVGHVAASFLIGNQDASSYALPDTSSTYSANKASDDTRLIPALDAKLGLTWNSLYANKHFGVGLEAGYQVAYYFNVIDQLTNPYASSEITHNYSDVGIMGPYMNVSAMF